LVLNFAAVTTTKNPFGRTFERAIDETSTDLMVAAKAHCTLFLLNSFINIVSSAPNATLKTPLQHLLALFAIGTIERELGEFTSDGFLSTQQCRWLKLNSSNLLALIRPNAVALVDAFDFSDFSLNSSLGRYDGDCYRDMYRRAQKDPRNQTLVGPAYEIGVKPWLTKSYL